MLAWMNREAFEETRPHRPGRATSAAAATSSGARARRAATCRKCASVFVDCDADTILLKVHQIGGAACHEGYASCFFRQVDADELRVVGERVFDPKQVYKK